MYPRLRTLRSNRFEVTSSDVAITTTMSQAAANWLTLKIAMSVIIDSVMDYVIFLRTTATT